MTIFSIFAVITASFSLSQGWLCEKSYRGISYGANFCWEDDDISAPKNAIYTDLKDDEIWWSVPLTDAYNNDEAYCLDGSMPHYYFRPGFIDAANNNDGTTKYYLFLQGGGWCSGIGEAVASDMDTCDHRATTDLGSTNGDAPTMTENDGYFSTDPAENPVMYNWNSLYLRYCDGASYTGNNDTAQPVTINGTDTFIYYRGHRILRGVLDSILNNNSLAQPTEFILLGCSAGGLGTFLNADFVYDHLNRHLDTPLTMDTYGAMPDSGYFMQYEASPNYVGGMQWVYVNQNSSVRMNEACTAQYDSEDEYYNCIFAQNIAGVTNVRLFPLQSQYDSWQLNNILDNTDNDTLVDSYGQGLTTSFKNEVLSNTQNGGYLSSCYYHCGNWDTVHIDSGSMGQGMYDWYYQVSNDENNQWLQIENYPCNDCCS